MNAYQLIITAIALQLAIKCDAFPTYAGTCGTGKAIANSGSHGANGSGSLVSGFLSVVLETNDITEFELSTETINVLEPGTDYSMKLKGSSNNNSPFKGFLIRLEAKNGQDISAALTETSNQAQSMPFGCASNVEAITHNSSSSKTEIPFELIFDTGGEYLLEVTVVRSRDAPGSNDWYYSSYDIKVEIPTAADSNVPSIFSSGIPSLVQSSTPSIVASMNPSGVPSVSPSSTASINPSGPPSVSPSSTASMNPSGPPSILPSSTATLKPSRTPSMSPSTLRSQEPTTSPAPNVPVTEVPSLFPSLSQPPSSVPSLLPSATISIEPSTTISIEPSGTPSLSPSVSHTPSESPNPSSSPSVSQSPTSVPRSSATRLNMQGLIIMISVSIIYIL